MSAMIKGFELEKFRRGPQAPRHGEVVEASTIHDTLDESRIFASFP
jgi:hypothetical protein